MVAGLLFLAFAFFAVGQASATRNGAQGAADSAALAAAQRARILLGPKLMAALTSPNGLDDVFKDEGAFVDAAHAKGVSFAAKNHSDVTNWKPEAGDRQYSFTFWVKTQYSVGSSVIPGTEQDHGTAHATAVIKLRCDLPPSGGTGSGSQPEPPPVTITCDGKDLPIVPMPDLEKIFTVKLVD
ncbi:pilus assembly protein TadG-related protein [Streptomyces violascens]|uniref:pilus assembly protein TadG-related protein n=1 Tax=Streptomyces violascens TaxID=67381 RepID=UPI00369B6D8E